MEVVQPINYFAVFLCAIIGIGLGALWYSPMLLGKIWVDSIDKSEEELEKDFKSVKSYSISFAALLVMAYIVARFMSYMGASTPEEGIRIAFMGWVGFTATTMTINMLFEGKNFKQFLIDSGYHFFVLIIFGFMLGILQ